MRSAATGVGEEESCKGIDPAGKIQRIGQTEPVLLQFKPYGLMLRRAAGRRKDGTLLGPPAIGFGVTHFHCTELRINIRRTAATEISSRFPLVSVFFGSFWGFRRVRLGAIRNAARVDGLDPLGGLMPLQAEIAHLQIALQILQKPGHGQQTLFHDQELGLGLISRVTFDQHLLDSTTLPCDPLFGLLNLGLGALDLFGRVFHVSLPDRSRMHEMRTEGTSIRDTNP